MRRALALLMLAAAAVAQQRPEEPAITARFRALAFSGPVDGGYTVAKGWTPLLITSDFLTAEQVYRGPADLTLLRKTPAGSTQPLATTRLADGARLILLIVPDGDGAQRVVQVDDTPGAFPYGTVRLFNLARQPLGLRGAGEPRTLPAGGEAVVRPVADARGYAMLQLLTRRNGEWGVGYNLRLFPQEDVRSLYFILPGPADSHAVALKGVEERRQPDPPAMVAPAAPGAGRQAKGPVRPDASR